MRILIVDKMHESITEALEGIGCEVDYEPDIQREEILQKIFNYQGIIVRSKTPIDKHFLSACPYLKFVARAGAGIDNVDMEAMHRLGIQLINAPEGNRDAVAEHTLALLLGLFNKIHTADRQVRNSKWDREGNRGVELMGKTVGILGFGYMGQAVAKRLISFGCRILAFDKKAVDTWIKEESIRLVDFETFRAETEVLSIHIPLNEENNGLINEQYLKGFKKLKYVINTARGEVLDLNDVLVRLEKKLLKGIALDVLPNEKMDKLTAEQDKLYKKLFTFEEVILSPHVAGWTHESYRKINKVLVDKIKKLSN